MTFILKREQETEELKKKHQKNKLLNEQQQENELKVSFFDNNPFYSYISLINWV